MEVPYIEGPEHKKCSSSGLYNDDGKKEYEKDWQEENAEMQKEIYPNTSLPYIAHGVICIAIPTTIGRWFRSQTR